MEQEQRNAVRRLYEAIRQDGWGYKTLHEDSFDLTCVVYDKDNHSACILLDEHPDTYAIIFDGTLNEDGQYYFYTAPRIKNYLVKA